MMPRFNALIGSSLCLALLAGCGAHTAMPVAALPAAPATTNFKTYSVPQQPADPKVQQLISAYQAITGTDAASFTQRDAIVAQLAETDNDAAMNFLMGEYDKGSSLPSDVKSTHEQAIANALATLDSYDASQDEAILKAGPGQTAASQEEYDQAARRHNRHFHLIRFLTTPLRWADIAIHWLYVTLNGGHHGGKTSGGGGHKPAPAPGGGGAPAGGSGPASDPSGGGGAPPAPAGS